MNKNIDLTKLRFLLHKYYEAETSPEEEYWLVSMFSEIKEEDCPEDLSDDRKLFVSMINLLPSPTDMQAPDNLPVKIKESISESSCHIAKDSKKKWKKPFTYASAVAVACMVLAFGVRYIFVSGLQNSPIIENQTEKTYTSSDTPNSIISDTPVSTKRPETIEPMQPIEHPKTQRKITVAEHRAKPKTDDGYIEITDPEEAQKIILEIGTLLAMNSQKTNEATQMVANTVEEYKEITKTILK